MRSLGCIFNKKISFQDREAPTELLGGRFFLYYNKKLQIKGWYFNNLYF